MATSVNELFTKAHAAIWGAWAPGPATPQPERAAEQWQAHLRGWPQLAASADHALRCVGQPLPTPIASLLGQIRRLATADIDGSPRPADPHLSRAAQLLAAGGDGLLLEHGQPPPGSQATDKILTVLTFAATATARSAWTSGHASDAEQWFRVAHALHGARQVLTPTSPTPAMTRPIVATYERSLAADLHAFHIAAWAMLKEPTPVPSRHLLRIPHTLHMIHRVASQPDHPDAHQPAADAWRRATLAWRDGVRIPGPPNVALAAAAGALGHTLAREVTGREMSLLRDYGADRARVIATAYADRVHETVHASLPVIAARRLAPSGMRPLPLDIAGAARAGRWVPLPLTSPPAQQILDATTIAASSQTYEDTSARAMAPEVSRNVRGRPPDISTSPGNLHSMPR